MTETSHKAVHRTCLMLLAGWLIALGAAGLAGCAAEETQEVAETAVEEPSTAPMAEGDPIARGEETYMTYCASCHGPEGKGNGEVAADLDVQPSNLTLLEAQNDGTFPVDSVYQVIDGRKDVEAHGSREMPVWGNIWSEEEGGEPVRREVVETRINELIEYLRTIQVEEASTEM